jgi:hypothetical protein
LGEWKSQGYLRELEVITSSWNRSGLFQLKVDIHLQRLRSRWQKVVALW